MFSASLLNSKIRPVNATGLFHNRKLNVVNFPGPTSRTVINGSTGTGKTFIGVWLLSSRDWRINRPCYIIDYKRDALIAECIEAAQGREISVNSKPPPKPGLYVIRPLPGIDDEAIEKFFWTVWSQEDAIVYVDEGYMIPKPSPAFRALLTQGRSKNIEMIILSQRPVFMDRFVFSEAEYFAVMRLNDARDRKTVCEMTGMSINYKLLPYHFFWYDGGSDVQTLMAPVPARDKIVSLYRKGGSKRKAKAL